jgi:pyridoxamine 5'-phosphate oxidase
MRGIQERELDVDPLRKFEKWFDNARASGEALPEAMALATASPAGIPSVRMVLFKGIYAGGFEFFTNFQSRKSQEMEANPRAAIVFWWQRLQLQVRCEGRVEKVEAARADEYFRTRPRGSQIGAWVSHQSQVIPDRAHLERRAQAFEKTYSGLQVPRPPFWGGFRLIPDNMEFWHGQANRLHDRFRYRQSGTQEWVLERLSP